MRKPDVELGFLDSREHFIPFRVEVLLSQMLADPRLEPVEHEEFRLLCTMLAERFHFEHHNFLESLKSDFVPFDPDRDTIGEPQFDENTLDEKGTRLYRTIRALLQTCNYRELFPEQMEECLKLQPVGGLAVHVDTEDFQEFHVYYRGIHSKEKTDRFLYFFKKVRTVPVLNRVFVIARFKKEKKKDKNFILKLFKDVSVENLKIIAPKVTLGMPILDRLKIGGTVLGSILTSLYKLFVAVVLSPYLFAIVLAGFLLAMFKGITGFINAKTKYLHRFSSNLYYRNLSNNKAAITSLVDSAEEQEVKEALLGYFILHVFRDREFDPGVFSSETENWIYERFGHRLEFEADDAIRKLEEKKLLIRNNEAEIIYKVLPLGKALRQLDEDWDMIHDFPELHPCDQ